MPLIGLRIQTQSQQYIYLPQGASIQKPASAMDFGFPGFLSGATSNGPIMLRAPLMQHDEDNLWLFVEMPVKPHWVSPFDAFFAKCRKLLPKLRRAPNFDETFPGLARLGEHYRSLKLSDLDGILEEEGKRSKGELDVFGAKIPSELLTVVGLPALCVLLLQFLSTSRYIRANTDTISVEAASKWSGLLKGIGFWLYCCIAIWALPIAASVLSQIVVPPKGLVVYCGFWIPTVLIVVFSTCALFHLSAIRKMVRPIKESTDSWEI